MIIYRRTALGNEAALDPNSPLPRKLRTLLISVDGKTRLSTYVNSLSSFGDVAALLESLQQAGLIENSQTGHAIPEKFAAIAPQREKQSPWSSTEVGSSSFPKAPMSQFSALDGNGLGRSDTREVSSFGSRSQLNVQSTYGRAVAAARPLDSTAQHQLRKAIELMSDFVTRHLPDQSLELVLSLESLGSVEQVIASLGGYEALISPIGEPAHRHLVELRTALATF